jgi:predicted nucleic acid-binding protein
VTVVPIKVVDASALAALVFCEPGAEGVVARLENSPLAAPTLLPFEMASVCLQKLRRYPESRDSLLAAYALSNRLGIKLVEVQFGETLALAEQTSLTVYDASYLWVAPALGAELITLDSDLVRAARRPALKRRS